MGNNSLPQLTKATVDFGNEEDSGHFLNALAAIIKTVGDAKKEGRKISFGEIFTQTLRNVKKIEEHKKLHDGRGTKPD